MMDNEIDIPIFAYVMNTVEDLIEDEVPDTPQQSLGIMMMMYVLA